jgi:Cu/Ag efflux pump CusA
VQVWTAAKARNSLTSLEQMLIDTPSGERVRLRDVADVRVLPAPNAIVREGGSRRIDVHANIERRDLASIAQDVQGRLQQIQFPLEYRAVLQGEYVELRTARNRLLLCSVFAAVGTFLLLQLSFSSWRLAILSFLTLPSALVGGVLAAYAAGGMISLGSLIGFLTVLGIAARNGIMMINHFQHLERYEGEKFGLQLVLRGAGERLRPILMTAATAGLAILPLVIYGDLPGHEIEFPMAVVILGGLVTSTLLNLFTLPALYLRFGEGTIEPADSVEGPRLSSTLRGAG